MLVFYRSADWCPYCKTQLAELQTRTADLAKNGIGLAAISYDAVPILADFSKRRGTTFPLLSDPGSATIHDLRQVTGVRYSGELGHPFHVVDDETVVLPLDHPFVKEGRFASLLVRDRELADSLAEGFQELWRKAMKNLREVQVDPRGHKS
jgi:predicted dithiol-disulfide oxidoreductase (DUF899 family)